MLYHSDIAGIIQNKLSLRAPMVHSLIVNILGHILHGILRKMELFLGHPYHFEWHYSQLLILPNTKLI